MWLRGGLPGCVVAALLAATPVAFGQSAALRPNVDIVLPATSTAREPSLTGTIIRDSLLPFTIRDGSGAEICRGTLQNRVVRSTATRRLDFYYRIRDTSGAGEILGIAVEDFGGETTRVGYRTDGLGSVSPTRAYRHPSPGARIVLGGMHLHCARREESRFILVRTESTRFGAGGTAELIAADGSRVSVSTADP